MIYLKRNGIIAQINDDNRILMLFRRPQWFKRLDFVFYAHNLSPVPSNLNPTQMVYNLLSTKIQTIDI